MVVRVPAVAPVSGLKRGDRPDNLGTRGFVSAMLFPASQGRLDALGQSRQLVAVLVRHRQRHHHRPNIGGQSCVVEDGADLIGPLIGDAGTADRAQVRTADSQTPKAGLVEAVARRDAAHIDAKRTEGHQPETGGQSLVAGERRGIALELILRRTIARAANKVLITTKRGR